MQGGPYDDSAVLERVVGTATFQRGRAYARTGAVLSVKWSGADQHLFGEVAGSNGLAYTTLVRIARDSAGRLTKFSSTCTCPVHLDCKHGVALFLSADPPGPAAGDSVADPAADSMAAAPIAVTPQWERTLRNLLRDDRDDREAPEIGLQFEVMSATRSYRTGLASPLRIGIRPVSRGRRGGWIKSDISWQNLTVAWGAHRGIRQEQIRLLREIAAMDPASRMSYSGGPNQLIYLDSFPTRRIWSVLGDADAAGLPFVMATRGTGQVRLLEASAHPVVELHREHGDLVLQALVTAEGRELPREKTLLFGHPAHGVGWWRPSGAALDEDLWLAPLSETADQVLHSLLELRRLIVPAADEADFFSGYYPTLRRHVSVVANDDTVELPQARPPRLVLDVHHRDDSTTGLAWHWEYTLGETVRRADLWPSSSQVRDRELDQEAVVVKSVEVATGRLAALTEPDQQGGRRLAASVSLRGLPAMRFLTDVLPQLAALPELTITTRGAPRDYREAQDGPVVALDASVAPGQQDWLDLAVTVTVDGEDVPFDQLFVALARGEEYLVLPTGTWFTLDRPELASLAALIAEARALNDNGPLTARVSRYQADLWEELEKLGVISEQAAAWQEAVRALATADTVGAPELPPGLTAHLRPYQTAGFGWLAFLHDHGLGGVLADEMGLGKTLQAIAVFLHAKAAGETRPFLVVAPTSVVYNWSTECKRFAPDLDVRIVTETGKRRAEPLSDVAFGAHVVVTSYALFRIEYDDYAEIGWAGLVLDEAQFVKNSKSRTYRCAKLLPAPFKLAITGTPMENNLLELWALMSITAPGLFPHVKGFEQHYRAPIEGEGDRERLMQLRRRIRPLMLRRTKEQVADDLPPKQEQVVELPLDPKHRRVYDTYLHRERQKVLGLLGDLERNRFEIFRSLTLLRQASLDVSLVDARHHDVPSTKLDALMELLAEISSEGHRTLVFSQFTRFLTAARHRLDAAKIDYCYLDGKTRQRPKVVEEFRSGSAPVFLISLKAGGFGLNLTEADYCVLLDPWWNPATEAQAIDRVHRIGQTRNVMVYRLVAMDTIEDKVMALKARKAALFDSVMSDGELDTGALTAADIRSVLE